MKLRLIAENIDKREFFDFYALLHAHQEKTNPNHAEIEQRLKFIAGHILQDHLTQLGRMLMNRLVDPKHEETKAILGAHPQLQYDPQAHRLRGVESLSVPEMAGVIAQVAALKHEHGFTGKTWRGLGQTFVELAGTPPGLKSQIMAVDKLYNLLHHGGQITDYMDESDWLEDALNHRDNANPAQISAMASANVRALVGRSAFIGMKRAPVNDLEKLNTALHRLSDRRAGVKTHLEDGAMRIDIDVTPIMMNGHPHMYIWGGDLKDHHRSWLRVGKRAPELDIHKGQPVRGSAMIYDAPDCLTVSFTNGQSEVVQKPINRQMRLIDDILIMIADVATTNNARPLRGYYHFRDKQPSRPPARSK